MKLRKKIVIFICIVAVTGLGCTFLFLHLVLLNRFEKLDEAALRGRLKEEVTSYEQGLQDMKRLLARYAAWDETYRLVSRSNGAPAGNAYPDPNFGPDTYQMNQFDVIALLNPSGEPVYGGVYDASSEKVGPLTPEVLGLLKLLGGKLLPLSGPEDSRAGVVMLGEDPVLITLAPVLNSNKNAPIAGTAIAGRRIHQDKITRIWDEIVSTVQITPAEAGILPERGSRTTWQNKEPNGEMSIHTVINDLFGNPGIVFTLKQPRIIYESGLQSISLFRIIFFIITALICLASLVFVNRFLLGRMSSLIRNIRSIASSKDLSIRIQSSGRDEFSEVEFEFNRMIGSLEQAQKELRQQAMLDPLTQLPNRSHFFAKLNEAIEAVRGTSRQIVLVFIDLDHFKTVNDTLGHDFGDAMLKDIALRLSRVIGPNDVISRLGGDEFTILLSDIPDSGSIEAQLKKIQEALAEPHRIQGHLLYNTASIGVSIYPQNGEDADYLVKQADLAMFHVKETGRNNIFQYSEALEESIRRKKILSQQLLSAAANGEFEIHYQPILSAESLQISKLEALLRWTSPTYGPVSPAEFIPLAETSGAIIHIGSWVLRQVCSDLRSFRRHGLELTAAVNISAMQLMQPGLEELLLELLHEYDLSSASLELEITESVLASGEVISASLLQLRGHGFRISLDDFGTGFSSLSYLRRFPVDVIKIDRSFVAEMTPDPQGDVLIRAIIGLSHSLGLRVVSEGVELKEQFDMLRRLGSDELQGYYISRPVRASAVYAFLTQEILPFDKK